jgi:hypothetical protein
MRWIIVNLICADLPEGLFRIPSSNVGLSQIRMTIDRGLDYDWSSLESINDAINLLKLYLQELPDPLFTHKLLQEWNSTKRKSVGFWIRMRPTKLF